MAHNVQNNFTATPVLPNSSLSSDHQLPAAKDLVFLKISTSATSTNVHPPQTTATIKEMFVTRSLERILAEKESKKNSHASLRKACERALGRFFLLIDFFVLSKFYYFISLFLFPLNRTTQTRYSYSSVVEHCCFKSITYIFFIFIFCYFYLFNSRETNPPSGVLPAPAAHHSSSPQSDTANGTAAGGNAGVLLQSEAYYLPFELACLSRHPKFIIIALDSLQVLFVISYHYYSKLVYC